MFRTVALRLAEEFGQPVVVENRAIASSIIGAEGAGDGYTLTMGNISTLAINAATFAKLTHDAQKSFVPVSMVVIQPLLGDAPDGKGRAGCRREAGAIAPDFRRGQDSRINRSKSPSTPARSVRRCVSPVGRISA